MYLDTKKIVISDTAPQNTNVVWFKPIEGGLSDTPIRVSQIDGWYYRQWSSGIIELYKPIIITKDSSNTRVTLPFDL
jgi:hypothetical protein